MTEYVNSRDNNTLPGVGYKDGDTLTTANGSKWVYQNEQWFPVLFAGNPAVQPMTASIRPDGGIGISTAVRNALRSQLEVTSDLKIVPMISAQRDLETYVASNCALSDDLANFVVGDRGTKMTMSGAVGASMRRDFAGGFKFGRAQCIGISIYIEDVTKVTAVSVTLFLNSTGTKSWARSKNSNLKNGWNYIRLSAVDGISAADADLWGTAYRCYAAVTTNSATTVTVGQVYAEVRPKATVVFIWDGPYEQSMRELWPELRAKGYPTVMASAPNTLGGINGQTGLRMKASIEQCFSVLNSGNGDEWSYHSWEGTETALMNPTETRADTRNCVQYLLQKQVGFGAYYRAAWTQNQAPNSAAAEMFMICAATPTSDANPHPWPPLPEKVLNIGRYAIFQQTAQQHRDMIKRITACGCSLWAYTHAQEYNNINNHTPEEWASWWAAVDEAVADGLLEVVNVETLFRRSGGTIKRTAGSVTLEWPQPDGSVRRVTVG